MATKNPRINVTFEQATVGLLSQLAQQQKTSVSSLVKELALEALEMREDLYLSKLAQERDESEAPTLARIQSNMDNSASEHGTKQPI